MIALAGITKAVVLPNGDVLEILRGVDLVIGRGDSVAILGRSGAGKSTLMHILGLLDSPDSGDYTILGQDPRQLPERERARLRGSVFGFVFQDYRIPINRAVWEVVSQPLLIAGVISGRRDRAREALSLVGLEDRWNDSPAVMSGGERQRVAVARALVNGSVCLLADEPTGNLDSATAETVLDVLFDSVSVMNGSLVVVTHDRVVAERCTRVVEIVDGVVYGR